MLIRRPTGLTGVRRWLVMVTTLAVLATGTTSAGAAQVTVVQSGTKSIGDSIVPAYVLQVADPDGIDDDVRVTQQPAGRVVVQGATAGPGCESADDAVACSPSDAFSINLGAGNDRIAIDGGPGLGGTIHAGTGADTLVQANGYTIWDGGPGPDAVLRGAADAKVTYEDRTAPVHGSFDGLPDDGEVGEGDDIGTAGLWVVGGSGDDVLAAGTGRALLDGGPGNDLLLGGPGDDILDGGYGNDVVMGGPGNDSFDRDDQSPLGSDVLDGGPGLDGFVQSGYPHLLTYREDGLANDGRPREGDNIKNIEHLGIAAGRLDILGGPEDNIIDADSPKGTVDGGAGNDRITVSAAQGRSRLVARGGPGNDLIRDRADIAMRPTLEGGPGRDTIVAHDRRDTVRVRDGETDTVTCTDGLLTPAFSDRRDRLVGCDSPILIATPQKVLTAPRARQPATIGLRCPARQPTCRGTVELRTLLHRVASRTVRIPAGTSRVFHLALTPTARQRLLHARFSGPSGLRIIVRRPQHGRPRPIRTEHDVAVRLPSRR